MKSLSLVRPLVIMVMGIPGSGKSFFARQFAETFHAPLVSCDWLRSQLFVPPSYSKEENALLATLTTEQLKELLKTERTILVDGGCNSQAQRVVLRALAKESGYGTLIIWVQTDQPTSMQRATKRNTRRVGDKLNTSLSEEIFNSQVKQLTAPLRNEEFIVISGKHTYPTQAKAVLKKLVSPREEDTDKHAYTREQPGPDGKETPRRRTVIVN